MENQKNCIFCKIIKGEIPSYKIYEDENTLAFLDIKPLSKGHVLVIPKKHVEYLNELDEETAKEVMGIIPKIASAVISQEGVEGWNLLSNNGKFSGQEIFHIHFHIIPRRNKDGLGYRWNTGDLDSDYAAEFVKNVSEKLK
ncbi:hit family protein [Anaeramoeba ignava]|uniref:Hit family protein n=1 Tax=Anaeramoeba ignava TaxID=1746090 RepID=A0A9Q0RDA6_ANAIG|nr:hit family protein [Anaeramoeba ignava]|eukprot:Anaeramoba_ignava/a482482_50.p1 GENE.a482482_50~~a482482_50.p1  ORF type:complete len:148 (-),score=49.50 a482482_50:31-453(-)